MLSSLSSTECLTTFQNEFNAIRKVYRTGIKNLTRISFLLAMRSEIHCRLQPKLLSSLTSQILITEPEKLW